MMISVGRVRTSVSTSGSTHTLNSCNTGSGHIQVQKQNPYRSVCRVAGTGKSSLTPLLLHFMDINKLADRQ